MTKKIKLGQHIIEWNEQASTRVRGCSEPYDIRAVYKPTRLIVANVSVVITAMQLWMNRFSVKHCLERHRVSLECKTVNYPQAIKRKLEDVL